ncbi:hypothetical protein CLOLEP_03917 [[Clostridium] leptum DSM 753]|jgi:hypothetical protein|uniref:DUF951 domain-containing protein n=3 Tax=[Clostridium] leptum TaxID=1535 RepID=A7VZ88_9FIRM|nr:hypothetical protein CLOLEP_03917 [[Clostridium] leptum DSM 753]
MKQPFGKMEVRRMDVQVGDILEMKKPHPCGSRRFLVLRSGMDFKIRCTGCGHEVMVPRVKAEKNIKKIIRQEQDEK